MTMAARKAGSSEPAIDRNELVPFTIRMPRGLLADLDVVVAKINEGGGWPKMTRSDLIRGALERVVREQSGDKSE